MTSTDHDKRPDMAENQENVMEHRERVRAVIVGELERFLAEEGVDDPDLREDTDLLACGLDSLGFAVLVTRLEDALQYDPFSAIEEAQFPATVGDLVDLYRAATPAA
jgi:acyl carrier protein